MFAITDTEYALAMRYNAEIDGVTRDAQRIVDRQDASIDALRTALRKSLAELEDERALRLAAELRLDRLNKLLDTPFN